MKNCPRLSSLESKDTGIDSHEAIFVPVHHIEVEKISVIFVFVRAAERERVREREQI